MWCKVFVLFLFSLTCCVQSKLDVLSKNDGVCAHIWTNSWKRIMHGIDLTKLDLQPVQETLYRKNGIRESLFNFSCFQNQQFSLPINRPQLEAAWAIDNQKHRTFPRPGETHLIYSLPDSLSLEWQHWFQPSWPSGNKPSLIWFSNNQSESSTESVLSNDVIWQVDSNQSAKAIDQILPEIRTFEEDEYSFARQQLIHLQLVGNRWKSSWLADAGFGQTSDFSGAFKLTQKYKRLRWQRLTNARIGHEARIQVPAYRLHLPEINRLPLSRLFRNAVERLNASENANLDEYEQIIHLFGTHFFTQLDFGGWARVAFRKLESADGIDLQKLDEVDGFDYKNEFAFEVRPERLSSEDNFAVETGYFVSNHIVYEKTITFYGGSLPPIPHPFAAWSESVPLNPWVIGGVVVPISELIKNPIKQSLMQKAILAYLDKAELLSTHEALKLMKQLNIWNSKLEQQLEVVDSLNQIPRVPHESILNASRIVQDLIEHELLEYYRNRTFVTLHNDKLFEVKNGSCAFTFSFFYLIIIFMLHFILLV